MYPELFHIPLPEWLQKILPAEFIVQGYGTMIALGIVAALLYAQSGASKLGIEKNKMIDLFIFVFIAAFIGGRFFHFFEKPDYYFGNPANMLEISGSGFVFYGSLIFAVPVMLWFFKKNKMPVMSMLDVMAGVALLVHMFGRMGCFLAGCCHGLPADHALAVTFTHPASKADPLGVPLHPTQLYEVFMLLVIFAAISVIRKRKQFEGQLFLVYIILYAIGRSIIEIFRGDEIRGFVLDGIISHSQFISIIIIAIAAYFYQKLLKRAILKARYKKA
ncbi:MAG: prolipoprotein diacylglyceryl transferase [Cyclobacteriaceae bacterium]